MTPRLLARRLAAWALALALAALCAVLPRAEARADAPATALRAARDLMGPMPGVELHPPPVPREHVVVRRGPLTISYPRAIEPQVRATVERAESDARSLAAQLGLASVPPLEIRLVPDPDTMRRLAPPEAPPPQYAVGVAYPAIALTLVSATAPRTWEAPDMRRVLRHELSHLLLESATGHAAIPRWLSEGVAIHQAAEHSYDRFTTLARASFTGGLVPLRRLDAGFEGTDEEVNTAYAQAADVVRFVLERGPDRFALLLAHLREGQGLDEATRQTYRASLAQLELEWRDDVRARFLTAPLWAGTGFLWLAGTLLLVVAYVRRRRKSRETLTRWAREESAAPVVALVAPGTLSGALTIVGPSTAASAPHDSAPDEPVDPEGPPAPPGASDTLAPGAIFVDGRRHNLN